MIIPIEAELRNISKKLAEGNLDHDEVEFMENRLRVLQKKQPDNPEITVYLSELSGLQ